MTRYAIHLLECETKIMICKLVNVILQTSSHEVSNATRSIVPPIAARKKCPKFPFIFVITCSYVIYYDYGVICEKEKPSFSDLYFRQLLKFKAEPLSPMRFAPSAL